MASPCNVARLGYSGLEMESAESTVQCNHARLSLLSKLSIGLWAPPLFVSLLRAIYTIYTLLCYTEFSSLLLHFIIVYQLGVHSPLLWGLIICMTHPLPQNTQRCSSANLLPHYNLPCLVHTRPRCNAPAKSATNLGPYNRSSECSRPLVLIPQSPNNHGCIGRAESELLSLPPKTDSLRPET